MSFLLSSHAFWQSHFALVSPQSSELTTQFWTKLVVNQNVRSLQRTNEQARFVCVAPVRYYYQPPQGHHIPNDCCKRFPATYRQYKIRNLEYTRLLKLHYTFNSFQCVQIFHNCKEYQIYLFLKTVFFPHANRAWVNLSLAEKKKSSKRKIWLKFTNYSVIGNISICFLPFYRIYRS